MSKTSVSPIHQKIIDINAKITKEQEALENAGSSAAKAAAKKRLTRAWASLEAAQDELAKEEKAAEKKAVTQGAATKKALAQEAAAKPSKPAKKSPSPSPSPAPEVPAQPAAGAAAPAPAKSLTEEELTEQVRIELEQRPDWKKLGAAGRKDAIFREVQARKAQAFKAEKAPKGKKEKKERKAGQMGRPSKLSPETKITLVKGVANPHREGTNAYGWFEDVRGCKTVADFLQHAPNAGYLPHWESKGLLTLG